MIDWTGIRYFGPDEFKCPHCGAIHMEQKFVRMLDTLRHQYGKPMKVTSGYRCPEYDSQISKSVYKAHTTGQAADIAVHGPQAVRFLKLALLLGFKGIGIQQKGQMASRFIHLDMIEERIWSY